MNRKQEIFEKVLKNSYEHEEFVGFVKEFLTKTELVAPNRYEEEKSNFSTFVNGYYHIGNYISDNLDKIIILSVCLNKGDTVERARGMQRNFVKSLIDNSNSAGAIVAFYTKENPEKWRLSFIRMDYEFSKGKVTEKLTPAKRYSYLVGKDEPCHTAMSRLYPIFSEDNKNPNIDAIEEAFSVETVTKEFFNEYCEKFYQLRDYLESNEHFMIEASVRNFTSEQFAKKLLGQIVFLYFIQKKGWLGVDAIPTALTEKEYKNAFFSRGSKSREVMDKVYKLHESGNYRIVFSELQNLSDDDEAFLAGIVKGKPWGSGPKDFMRRIFDGCISARKNYFDDYLEPLFYTGLNKNRGDNGFYAPLHRRIPFLNGGLFEQLDNYEWENNNFAIPNELFSNREQKGRDADGILDIFDRYNFTMNEDEPMEREVAIDPEMLGKVFENLLDVKDRKSKGAFYTPREIVHYMCQETLINHLVNKTGLRETDIRDFILYGDLMKDEDTVKSIREGRGEMLISSEILDLKKGVNRLKELDDILANVKVADLAVGSGAFPLGMLNEIVKARETLSAYMSIGMNGFQKKSFYAYERKPYILKMNTIKNCIFACDIEPSAVDIAKLRLWLSIVIDDEISDEMGNGDFDAHTQPRQLPNLDCNIICGNSLIDEFKGNKLITESDLLHNVSSDSQIGMFQGGVDTLINELIKLQDKLFYIKDHDEKEDTKSRINKIYNEIVLEQIHGNPELVKDYFEAIEKPSKPFILWQLYFPQVFRDYGGFDIVIGNPPYGAKFSRNDKKVLDKMYLGCNVPDYESANFFIELGELLLNNQGELSFIIPNMFMANLFAQKYRNHLIEEWDIRRIDNFSDIDVFDSAKVRNCIVFFSKLITGRESCFTKMTIKNGDIRIINQKYLSKLALLENIDNWLNLIDKDEIALAITTKMNSNATPLNSLAEISQGLIPYDKYRGHSEETIKNKIWNATYKKDDTYKKQLRGKDIDRYRLEWNGDDWISYGEWLAAPRKSEFFINERILIREITSPRILATYTSEEFYNTPSIINCINFKIDIYFVLGIINSELISFYHNIVSPKASKGLFPKILVNDVRNIPICVKNENIANEISENVREFVEGSGYNEEKDRTIDRLVYKLYEITDDEQEYIKNWYSERKK